MALEPRLMYDGAAVATVTAVAGTQPHTDASAGSSSGSSSGSSASSAPSSAAPATDHAADHPATPSSTPTDTSSASTPADSSAGTGSPAAPATPSSTAGHQIVFIDGNVPDAEVLAQGVQPGIEVVILDPNSNGVQQIADYLTSHNEQNLDAIQIVSHGEEATMRLGNTIFGLADISMFSSQLATWGAALKPGGDINLYGCNVGEGADGAHFEVLLSMATGGAHVAASNGLVGAASLGGSWNLNVTVGTNNVGNPFTAATLGQYDDILTNQIWFTGSNSSTGDELVTANVSGATAISPNGTPPGFTTPPNPPFTSTNPWENESIAIDAADGLYFVANNPTAFTTQAIYEGHISGSGGLTQIYATPNTNGVDFLGGMVFNPANHKLYFVVSDNTAVNGIAPGGGFTVDTGIYTLNIAANGTASGLTRLVSWGGASGMVNPHDIAIDNADNLLFFTDFGDSQNVPQTYNPRLEVANLTTGTILNSSLQSLNINSVSGSFYYIWGVEVDPASHRLYWVTADPTTGVPANIPLNQILEASFTTGATPTLGTVTALYTATATGAIPGSLAIDVANGVYYAALGSNTITTGTLIEGSLSTPGTPTTIYTMPSGTQPQDILFEPAPVLSVSTSSTPTTTPGAAPVDLSSSVTLTDTMQNIASATVTISGGFQTGDTLAATTAGTSITASFNSTNGVLTLSGADTAAHYQSVLDSVTFATTATTGIHRGFTWSTTDGHLASNTASSSANVNFPPSISAGTSVTYHGGDPAVVLDSGLTISDASTATLTGATVSITGGFQSGDTLTFTPQGGVTGSYNSATGVLTFSGSVSVGTYKALLDSVAFSVAAGTDPTSGSTSRTISWQVTDSNNLANSPAATSTVTTVHTAPTVTTGGTVTFTGGGSPVTLDSTLALGNIDSNNSLKSATISISTGFQQSVDVLSVNLPLTAGTITGTNITVSYNGTTGVLTLSGADSFANYLSALNHVQYSTAASNSDPTNGGTHTSRTISWAVTDNSTSNNTSTTGTSSLTTVHAAPSLSISGSPQYSAGGSPAVLLSAASLSDVDSGGFLSGATVSITGGFLAGDTLNFTAQNGISVQSYVNGVLTLTGSASIANYAAALQTITFSSSVGDPTNGGADNSRTITWQVTDGSSSNGTSNVGQLTLAISAQPPSITGTTGITATYFATGAAVALDGSVGVTDLASTTLSSATVSITGHFLLGDTLAADTTGTSITARYDRVHGVLTLSGSDTLANYQTVLDRVTYSSTAPDPTAGASANSRTISWQVNDGRAANNLSSIVTTSVDVTHIAPTETAGGSVPWQPGNGPVVVDSTVTVADADINHSITVATVTISSGKVNGDTLAFNGGTNTESFGDGSTITGTYNSATGVLTLTAGAGNPPTAADFQLALQSVTFDNSSANVSASNPGGTRMLSWSVNTAVASSVTTQSFVQPPTAPSNDASSFPSGTTSPPATSGLTLNPVGASGLNTPGIGTLVSGTSGIVTLGTSTSGSGTVDYGTSGAGTFDPTLFGSGAGGPGYFDPGGGFGSGLDFSSTFTTASNDVPADSETPLTLFADGSLGFGFDQKTDSTTDRNVDKGVDDAAPATPEKAIAVAEKDAANPDPTPASDRLAPADAAPVAGKVALSAQLRAAGRHGFLHDRLALLKSLHSSVRG